MSGGTVYLVMGAPGAGTYTLMERVKEALADSPGFCFPRVVASGASKRQSAEVVSTDEFQRRKVSGELQLCWSEGGVEMGVPSFLRAVEAGVNVAVQVPQSCLPKVEKLFMFHKKRSLYVTASQELRSQRAAAAGRQYTESAQGKPEGPSVSTIVNSGTISEGAADLIAAMKQHGKETVQFPPSAVTLTVLPNAKSETRAYLSEQLIPGLTTALTAISKLAVKPRNPYLWLAGFLEADANLGAQGSVLASPEPLLAPGSFVCRQEAAPHVLDDPSTMEGVANLRRLPGHERVLGLHQPSAAAIRELVAQLCGVHGKVVWVSLRDTPVVYVNGMPHCFDSKEAPGQPPLALRAQCISSGKEMHRIERQLVRELADQASHQGGSLQLFPASSTKDASNVEPEPVPVGHTGVRTLQDLFDELEAEGFDVCLRRALLPEEGPPEPEEVDELLGALREVGSSAAVVCNCGSGVERTELAMVLTGLALAVEGGAEPRGYLDSLEGARDLKGKAQYQGIMELIGSLGQEGQASKAVLDDLLDDHAKLVHFRNRIHTAAQTKPEASAGDVSKAVCVAMEHLDTYWHMIALAAYLRQQVKDKFQQSFATWIRGKRAIRRSLHKLCLV